jgi:two-component system CheB/CheR fusion protein
MFPPQTLCVLVVDDNQDSADSFGVLVRLWGYEPVIAYNTQSAQELASIYRPKAVLLNLGLPAENGLELARRLRQRPELQTTALIAVSGYSNEDIRRRAAECGIESFLVKPVEPTALQALLEQIAAQLLTGTIPMAKKTKKMPRPAALQEKLRNQN